MGAMWRLHVRGPHSVIMAFELSNQARLRALEATWSDVVEHWAEGRSLNVYARLVLDELERLLSGVGRPAWHRGRLAGGPRPERGHAGGGAGGRRRGQQQARARRAD